MLRQNDRLRRVARPKLRWCERGLKYARAPVRALLSTRLCLYWLPGYQAARLPSAHAQKHVCVGQERVPRLRGFCIGVIFELTRQYPDGMDDIAAVRIDRATPRKGSDCVQVCFAVAPVHVECHQLAILAAADGVTQPGNRSPFT